MWNWFLDHWWVATMIPYFGFNAWVLKAFFDDNPDVTPRDRSDLVACAIVLTAGVPIMAGYGAAMIAAGFWNGITEGVREVIDDVRLDWRLFAARFAATLVTVFVLDVLYVFSLAVTEYRPGWFEKDAIQLVFATGSWWLAAKIINRRGRRT